MSGRGLFVVIEGIDGAGKSEQCKRLAELLRSRRHLVVQAADGRRGIWGDAARAWARGERHPFMTAAELDDPVFPLTCFARSRYELAYSEIQPALNQGAIVVCDRWEHSTWAYQSAAGVAEELITLWTAGHRPPVSPDLAFWLQIEPAEALSRIARDRVDGLRPEMRDRYEAPEFLERVAAYYDELYTGARRVPGLAPLEPVNADRAPGEVAAELEHRVLELWHDIAALTRQPPLRVRAS